MKEKFSKYFYDHDKYMELIKAIVFIGILIFMAVVNVKSYLQYKDKVTKVSAKVVDSLNYVNDIKGIKSYNSRMVIKWEKDGKEYSDSILISRTVLIGESIDITVLKEDPSVIKAASFSNAIGTILFTIFILGATVLAFNIEKVYKKIVIKEKKKNELYTDVFEDELFEKKRSIRKRRFLIIISLFFLLIAVWQAVSEYNDYKIFREREYVEVECLVLKSVYDENKTTIIGEWEYDGQLYKRQIDDLEGKFEEGKTYNIKVFLDTEESRKLGQVPRTKNIIGYSFMAIVAFIVFLYAFFRVRTNFVSKLIELILFNKYRKG